MVTQLDCAMLEDACKSGLRTAYTFTFENDSDRDAYFSASPSLLENSSGKQTLIFVGTSNLKYAYWNGQDRPSSYDAQYWVEIAIDGSTTNLNTIYWGDPSTDLSMRARRDQSTGYLIFERRVSGSWVEKFKISDSATVDTVKLTEAVQEPIIQPGELGLYNASLKDGDHGDASILRPIFSDSDGNHFPVVAGAPDGSLRVPQNIDAALANPAGVPVQYKKVMLEDERAALDTEIAANKTEIERIKTDTSGSGLPIFSWYDRGVPTLPTDQQKAYYIHIRVLPDSAQAIQIPANTPEDCIFSIENNDRDDYVTILAAAGETINGASSYQAQSDTLSLFVKSGTNFDLAYGGVFPNTLTSLKSSIQVLLTGQLHTIGDIQAQLKDHLHTFNEIQTHFSDKLFTRADGLPTAQEIITALESDPGNPQIPAAIIADLEEVRKYSITNGNAVLIDTDATIVMLDYEGTASVTQTLQNLINVREGTLLAVRTQGLTSSDSPVITLLPGASGQTIEGQSQYELDVDVWALFAADKKANNWVELSQIDMSAGGGSGGSGINIDDGTSDVAGVERLNIKGMMVTEIPNSGGMGANEAEVTAGVNIHMAAPNQQFGSALANEIILQPPLNTYIDPNQTGDEAVILEVKPGSYEPMHQPSFLAYLAENEDIVGKIPQGYENTAGSHHNGAIWFDDIVVPEGAYIELRKADKTYGIQESDELDPNVTGGTDYLIAARIHMKGKAPSDGFVRLYLYNKSVNPFEPTGYLLDKNGQPMAVERHYRQFQELGILDVMGVVNAKGLQEFTVHVVDSFTNDILEITDRTEGASGIMIQALSSDEKSGLGLLQFENDTDQNIEFSSHYLGVDRMNLNWINSRPESPKTYTAGTHFTSVNGWRLINLNGLKVGVVDGHTHIQDDGVHLADFNYGKVFSAEETVMLRGKDINVTATVVDKDSGFRVGLMKWTGKPDEYTPEIYTTRGGGGQLEFQTDWAQADSLFVSEDVVSGDHTLTKTMVVPADANNYAIVIYPVAAQLPVTLKLKQLKVDVSPAFTGYALQAPELLNEIHLYQSEEYKEFVQNTQGNFSLRYTINPSVQGLPMPVGIPTDKGKLDIELDDSVNQISGSQAKGGEGALKFGNEGRAKLVTTLRLWNEQSSDNTVKFWWSEVSPDGNTFTKLVDSEFTFNVPANSKEVLHRFAYSHDFEVNDRVALRASASKADGAFLQCVSDSRPMVDVAVTFTELVEAGDTTDLINGPYERKLLTDQRVIPFSGITGQNYEFDLDVPSDVEIGQHSVVGLVGGNIVSIDNSEFSYNPTTNKMTVRVGNINEGKIYLTFWG